MSKIMLINDFVNKCEYFYNADYSDGICVNIGYNCNHPDQQEVYIYEESGKKVGLCYCSSCTLGYEVTEDDFNNTKLNKDDYEYAQGEFVVVEDESTESINITEDINTSDINADDSNFEVIEPNTIETDDNTYIYTEGNTEDKYIGGDHADGSFDDDFENPDHLNEDEKY